MKKEERKEREQYLKGIVNNLPESPGCYQYTDEGGTIIYVGKAKNLKRRVSSYFNKEQQTLKTKLLVSKICDIKYIVVNSEADALLLENNLIKQHKPRYNVLLKDDKTYPSICITNEYFPKLFKTRKIVPGAGKYFGPYTNAGALNGKPLSTFIIFSTGRKVLLKLNSSLTCFVVAIAQVSKSP